MKHVNKETRDYRKLELSKVQTIYSEYPAKIKIIKPDGETKWLDITELELKQITHILTSEI